MNNTFTLIIVEFILAIFFTVKAKTVKSRQFGKSVLLYRLTGLLPFLYLFFTINGVFPFRLQPAFIITLIIIDVIAFIYYLFKKSLFARDYAILILTYCLIGSVTPFIALAIQIFMFIRDFRK